MSRLRAHGFPALGLLLVALASTWPAAAQLGEAIPGHPQSDAYEHLQGYWWVLDELRHGEWPIHATQFGIPEAGSLWFPDTLGAILSLPIQVVLGAPVAYTVVVVAQLWLAMLAAYAMGLSLGGGRAGGWLAAVIFGVSPFALGLVYSGVSEYFHLAPFPLLFLGMLRFLEGRGSWVIPALAWGWLGWANGYYGLFGAVVVLMAAVSTTGATQVILRQCISVGLVATLIAAPNLLATWYSLHQADSLIRSESAPGWDWVYLPANDLLGFVVPGDHFFPDMRARGNHGIRHVAYLGLAGLLVAVPGLRRWWKAALLAGVLALGPTLHVNSKPVRVSGHIVPLPAALLYLPGSPFRGVHHPYRLVVLPMLVLAAAASALGRRPRLAVAASAAVLADTWFVSPAAGPLATASVADPDALPEPGGRWDFPPEYRDRNRQWLGLQAVHGRPVPYTLNVFLPRAWRDNAAYQQLMACLDDAPTHTVSRDGHPPLQAWLVQDSAQTLAEGIEQLRDWGLRYIVVHEELLSAPELSCVASVIRPGRVVDLGE
ncbi:MAG: hypothetical protein FJ102_14295 [Deltaproteobacteria bacterium]|nr:hypothetical protein [Deltaproteobacteria bacterium]